MKVRAVDVAGNISSTLVSSVLYKKSLPGSNGTVKDLNYDNAGKILYLAGDFSYLGHPTGSAVILDNSTGNGTLPRSPEQNINAAVNGKIYAVAPSSLGGYFIGGEFTSIGGISGFSNLAYVGVDGVPSDWKPAVNGPVESLMVSTLGSTPYLFVGGNYTSIMGTAKTNLSALSLSGLSKISSATLKPSALTSWNPAPNGEVLSIAFHNGYNILAFGGKFTQFQGAANNYFAMVDSNFLPIVHTISPNNFVRVLASGNTGFYLGGDFTSVSGSSRGYGALVSIASGMILTSWDPLANATIRSIYCWSSCIVGGDFSNIAGGARNAIAILGRNTASLDASFTSPLPSGSKVYSILDGVNWTVAGDFNDPTTRRRNIASLDNTTGAYIGGMNQPSASGPVYVVTNNSASSLNLIFIGGDFFSAGGVERSGLAAIDLNTYQVSSVFAPRITYTAGSGGGQMQNISRTGSRLFATGNFSTVNGLSRAATNNLIEFDTTSGTATSFEPTSSAGTISKTQIDGTTLYVLGSFMDIGGDNSHIGLAKYDISTATPALQAYTAGLFFGSTVTKVLPVAGNQLIIGGTFATIQGQLRYSLARVDASTGNLDTNFLSPVLSGNVFDIQLDTDNNFMWVTGSISFLGVPSSYDVGYVDVLTGSISPLNFSPSSPGGYVKQLIDLGSSIFIAGPFSDVNSVSTKGLAQVLKADTTVVTPFTSLNLNAGVNKVETDGSGFYFIGGSFSTSGSSNTPSSSLLFIDGAGHVMTGFPW